MRKLLLGLLLILALTIVPSGALGCILPDGTHVFVFNGQYWHTAAAPGDQEVEIVKDNPPPDSWKDKVSEKTGEDWSDAVLVYDKTNNVYAAVKMKDLDCSGERKK